MPHVLRTTASRCRWDGAAAVARELLVSRVTMHRPPRIALVLCFLACAACSEGNNGGGGEPADHDNARSGWRSTETALAAAGVRTGWSQTGTVTDDGATGAVMGAVDCPEGGSMEIDAAGTVEGEDVSAALSIEFIGCAADGVTIDGMLEYAAHVTEAEVSASIMGNLQWSGGAEGTCDIDLEASVSQDGDNVSASAEVSGGMCGLAWQDVF